MAVVHVAVDAQHDRKVAIKVLRGELAASLEGQRFLREIQTASRRCRAAAFALGAAQCCIDAAGPRCRFVRVVRTGTRGGLYAVEAVIYCVVRGRRGLRPIVRSAVAPGSVPGGAGAPDRLRTWARAMNA